MFLRLLSFSALLFSTLAFAAGCSKDPEVAKREFVASGDAYVGQQKYQEAIIEYRNAVQQDGLFAEARTKLTSAYLAVGDLQNAHFHAVRAADLLPNDVRAQVRAGELLVLAGQMDEASARADKALAIEPNNVDALILRAHALAGLNKLDDAIAEIEAAIRNDPTRGPNYARLGSAQLAAGRRQQAEVAFRKAVEVNPNSVAARLGLANFLWTSSRLEQAEAALKEALALDPQHTLANRSLAIFYVGTGRTAEAEPYLKTVAAATADGTGKLTLADYYLGRSMEAAARAVLADVVKNHPSSFAAATLRLAALGSATDTGMASRLVDEVLAREPNNVEALLAKGQLLAAAGRLDEALAAVRAGVAANPGSSLALFSLGRVHEMRRETNEAIKAFVDALRANPRMAAAEVELARMHMALNRWDEAEQFARGAVSKIPGHVEAHLMLARIAVIKGNAPQAERTLDVLAKALPRSPTVQTELARLALLKKNPTGARAAFERALALDSRYFDALSGLVQMDLRERRLDAVKTRLDAAVKSMPQNIDVLVLAANTYAIIGDAASAERLARQTIELDANNPAAYSLLGHLYISQRRLDSAIAQFTALAAKRPGQAGTHTVLGMLYQMQGKLDDAKSHYERALATDAEAAIAANNLAGIISDEGEGLDRGLQLAQAAKRRLPDHPSVNDTLGWLYHQKGQSQMAIGPFEEAIQKVPDNAKYRYHLGAAYAATGNAAKAREALEKALELGSTFDGADEARRLLAELKG
jgi:tetratricopeptide (TPR) repeat protein